MSGEPQLYRINPQNRESEKIQEVEFAQLGLQERRDIQEWVAANPGILGDDLLIIGKEFSGFDRTNERLDLLAVDRDGKLVIIELKRDDTGADAHWQAIKYASYFQRATADEIVAMAADYLGESQAETATRLMHHLDADDLNDLNQGQRIILASHRFAPEVTTAAIWLNDQFPGNNLITCITLIPYRDAQSDALFLQASAIIPTPGIDEYLIGIGQNSQSEIVKGSSLGSKLSATFARNRDDEVTPFLRKVGQLATDGLPARIKPDRKSRWAGDSGDRRHYHLWYSRPPWGNWKMSYSVDLHPQEEAGKWGAAVLFENRQKLALPALDGINLDAQQNDQAYGIFRFAIIGTDTLNDDFANEIAKTLRDFIEQITPIVDDLGNESSETDALPPA